MSRMRFRILQILEKNRFDTGSVHQMFQAATGLGERGHEVIVVSRPGSELAGKAREAGVGFHALPLRHELDLRSVRELRHLVKSFRPDVIHVHKGLSHTLALAATWSRPVPAFIVNRGVSFGLTIWNRAKYRTRRVDRIVTVCERIRDVIVRTGRVDPAKIEVIYAGTDVNRFDPERWPRGAFRSELRIPENAFLISQVGVRDWKGWRDLVDAFTGIAAGNANVRLALVGCRDETERDMVRQYAESRGVEALVVPVGVRDDMPNVLAASDCVVDASWSGTGVTGTIREAMALERPVVTTDCGGNRELVSSPELGWVIPPRTVEAMASALNQVIAGRDRAAAVGAAARRHVVERFSQEARIDRLERLYRSIVRGRHMAN